MNIVIIHYAEPVSQDPGYVLTRYGALAKTFIEDGHHITRIFPSFNHRSRKSRDFGSYTDEYGYHHQIETNEYKNSRSLNRVLFLRKFRIGVLKYIQANHFDMYVVGVPMPGIAYQIRKIVPTARILIDVRDIWPDVQIATAKGGRKLLYKLLGATFKHKTLQDIKAASKIVTLSASYAQKIKNMGERDSLPKVIPLGANNTSNIVKAKQKGVVFVGSLSDLFDFPKLIRIWNKVQSKRPDLTAIHCLTIVGHGAKSDWIQSVCTENDEIKCTGFIPQEMAIEKMQNARLAIAIYNEMDFHTLPNKLFEYSSSKLPIVSNWSGDVYDITKDYLFAFGNSRSTEDELSNYVIELLSNENKYEIAKRGAKEFAEKYSRMNLAQEFKEFALTERAL